VNAELEFRALLALGGVRCPPSVRTQADYNRAVADGSALGWAGCGRKKYAAMRRLAGLSDAVYRNGSLADPGGRM
jgi:hypothetical protein